MFSSIYFKLNYLLLTVKLKTSTDSAHSTEWYPCPLKPGQCPTTKAHLPKPTGKTERALGGQQQAQEKCIEYLETILIFRISTL